MAAAVDWLSTDEGDRKVRSAVIADHLLCAVHKRRPELMPIEAIMAVKDTEGRMVSMRSSHVWRLSTQSGTSAATDARTLA